MAIIGTIRKHSWIAVAIVGIAILAFIAGDLTKNNRSIPDMGKVDGTVMTHQRFDELVEQMEDNYKMQQQASQIPSEVQSQIREQVWQNFIDETLLGEQTTKLGLQVTAAEVTDMYTGTFIHPYLRQNFTNPQTGQYDAAYVNRIIENFDQLDTADRMRWVEMEKTVKKDRQQQKYAGLIMNGLYMPKPIAAKIAEYSAEASNVRIAALPYQSVKDEEITVADADYKNYYEEHKAEFRVMEEMRDLEFIVYPVNPTQKDLAQIESDVNKVWEEFQTLPNDEIPFFVNAESEHSYDSSYVKSSSFAAPLSEQIAAAEAGTFIAPAIVGNEWMMAKVLRTAVRPDSIRASVIYVLNQNAGTGITTRSNDQAKVLADSVLALLNGNKMTFEAALEQFSDDPQKNETKGETYAGRIVAPVIAEAADVIIDHLGMSRESAASLEHSGVINIKQTKAVQLGSYLPDFTGLSKKDLIPLVSRNDIHFIINGSGWVTSQNPPAGTPLSKDMVIELNLES